MNESNFPRNEVGFIWIISQAVICIYTHILRGKKATIIYPPRVKVFAGKEANSGPSASQKDVGMWIKSHEKWNVLLLLRHLTDILENYQSVTGFRLSSEIVVFNLLRHFNDLLIKSLFLLSRGESDHLFEARKRKPLRHKLKKKTNNSLVQIFFK